MQSNCVAQSFITRVAQNITPRVITSCSTLEDSAMCSKMSCYNYVDGVVDARTYSPVIKETDGALLAQGYKYYSPTLDENLFEVEVVRIEKSKY